VGAPDADILAAAIKILRKRVAAGTATFLVKGKRIEENLRMREPTFWRGYFRSKGRQRVMPTDESSSLHVEKAEPRGRESNLSRWSFDI